MYVQRALHFVSIYHEHGEERKEMIIKEEEKSCMDEKILELLAVGSFLFACTAAARRGDVGAMGEGGLCQLFRSALWLLCNKT